MVVADIFGWKFTNLRLLADHHAKAVDATVYLPDFFGGQVISPQILRGNSRWGKFDLKAWRQRNSKENRWDEIFSCAKALRSKYNALV